MFSTLLKRYNAALAAHPLRVKVLTSGALFAVGDVVAQTISPVHQPRNANSAATEKSTTQNLIQDPPLTKNIVGRYDWGRTARMSFIGACVFAPLAHGWYNILERLVVGQGTATLLKKVAFDQLTWTPVINVVFLSSMALLDGRVSLSDPSPLKDIVGRGLVDILPINWTVWPVAQLINFRYVSLHNRVLFINVINIGWTAFLSKVANKNNSEDNDVNNEELVEAQ